MNYQEAKKDFDYATAEFHVAKLDVKIKKRIAHKEFLKHTKKFVLAMDFLMISFVIFNFGAVFITNALVVRDNPGLVLLEANPKQSELNGYAAHPKGNELLRAVVIQSLMWAVLLSIYLFNRMHFMTYGGLWLTGFVVLFYFFLLWWDFFNDLGFLIGKIIWGI